MEGEPRYVAVETLLNGLDMSRSEHGQAPYVDKDGHSRGRARLRWWNDGAGTLRDLAEMGGKFTTAEGVAYPELPEIEVSAGQRSYVYDEQVPVFYGHYWRQGAPTYLHDWTDFTAFLDFSAVKGGALTAYRWSGETRIRPDHYVSVSSSAGNQNE